MQHFPFATRQRAGFSRARLSVQKSRSGVPFYHQCDTIPRSIGTAPFFTLPNNFFIVKRFIQHIVLVLFYLPL